MSLFLGPIHHWLYGKIQKQEALTQALAAAFPAEKDAILAKVDAACGQAETRPLEEVIDETNIHGWLQANVTIVEKRLALTASELLKTDTTRIETLKKAAFDFGKSITLDNTSTPQNAFQSLNNILLDGMPCDHVNTMVDQNEHSFCWERSVDLHSDFWINAGGDASIYDELRNAWISGMLDGTKLTYKQDGNRFYIQEA